MRDGDVLATVEQVHGGRSLATWLDTVRSGTSAALHYLTFLLQAKRSGELRLTTHETALHAGHQLRGRSALSPMHCLVQ